MPEFGSKCVASQLEAMWCRRHKLAVLGGGCTAFTRDLREQSCVALAALPLTEGGAAAGFIPQRRMQVKTQLAIS